MPTNVLYYGDTADLPRPVPLRAGPLELLYLAGDLRYIRLGDREVVRRIYWAARDADWGTAPNVIERETIEAGSDTFTILTVGHSRLGELALAWQAELLGAADGTLTVRVRARAEGSFLANRIGLCLLHPAPECAGAACRVTHSDGSVEEGRFPVRIAPHQPFLDIRAFAHEVLPGVWATATFTGDIFEMEDQRNWTDASWKTYSRPLALPIPYRVRQGERVEQSITLRLEGLAEPPKRVGRHPRASEAEPLAAHAAVAAPSTAALPPLGLSLGAPLAGQEIDALRRLELGHLRVATATDDLGQAAAEARALGLPLELALAAAASLDEAAAWLRRENLPLARVLLGTTPEADTLHSLALARAEWSATPIGSGVDGYFTNLNRERPPATGADLVFYSLNPQVHAFDNDSLVETLPTQAETVRSAQALYPGLGVVVSPITLRPRKRPEPDPRQPSLFAAGWTLGSIASLTLAGVASLTYYRTAGPHGILESGGAGSARLFPVYHLLAWLAGWRGALACPVSVNETLRLQGLALRRGGQQRLILANLGLQPQEVSVTGLGAAARVSWLDERALPSTPQELAVDAGRAIVPLWPYGLACIDSAL
ncbi:MAG: hypothetical protein ABFD20_04460 [Anaerolineales bacterium]